MLVITYDKTDVILTPRHHFDSVWEEAWLEDDFAKRAIKDIDKTTVLSPHCLESSVLGQIPPTDLSRGVKTVLLVKNQPEFVFNGSACGDNCAKWLLEATKGREQRVFFEHIMNFDDCDDIEIKFEVTGQIARSAKEYVSIVADLIANRKIPW